MDINNFNGGYYVLNIFCVSGTLCDHAQTKFPLTINLCGEGNHSCSADQNTQTEGHPHPGSPNSKFCVSFHEPGISVVRVRRPLAFGFQEGVCIRKSVAST